MYLQSQLKLISFLNQIYTIFLFILLQVNLKKNATRLKLNGLLLKQVK